MNAVTIGESVDVILGTKTTCVIDEAMIGSAYSVNFSADGVQFLGNVYTLVESMRTSTVINFSILFKLFDISIVILLFLHCVLFIMV